MFHDLKAPFGSIVAFLKSSNESLSVSFPGTSEQWVQSTPIIIRKYAMKISMAVDSADIHLPKRMPIYCKTVGQRRGHLNSPGSEAGAHKKAALCAGF